MDKAYSLDEYCCDCSMLEDDSDAGGGGGGSIQPFGVSQT